MRTLLRKINEFLYKLRPQTGAGVMLVANAPDGPECYLGQRIKSGVWSIMGGGIEPEDRGDLFKNAFRELEQEARPLGEKAFTEQLIKEGVVHTLYFNLFNYYRWKTYIVLVKKEDFPAFELVPYEFRTGAWFKFSQRPAKLHFLLWWPILNWGKLEKKMKKKSESERA